MSASKPANPWVDAFDLCMRLWAAFECEHAATKAGREFSRRPRLEPAESWSKEMQAAYDSLVAEYDSMARPLSTETQDAA